MKQAFCVYDGQPRKFSVSRNTRTVEVAVRKTLIWKTRHRIQVLLLSGACVQFSVTL